jgi:hypothetical protein
MNTGSQPGENHYRPTDTLNHDINTLARDDPLAKIRSYRFGQNGGSDYRKISINDLPAHNHGVSSNATFLMDYGVEYTPTVRKCNGFCGTDGLAVFGATTTTDNKGGGWHFGISPPYYVLVYVIKL